MIESEPWSCVPGTPPISHHELTSPAEARDFGEEPEGGILSRVPRAVVREWEAQLDEYMESYEAFLREAWGIPKSDGPEHPADVGHDQSSSESTVTALRYVTKPNGRQVQIDHQGWGLKRNGQRDLRYKERIGPPLPQPGGGR